MSSTQFQLVDWFIFFTTSATFVLYKRRQRQSSDTVSACITTKTASASKSIEKIGSDVVIVKSRHEATATERQLQQEDSLRLIYKPWCMTESAFNENQNGWVYVRGYSPGKHSGSVLFFRPGLHKLCNDRYEAYFRALLNGIEVCIADSLERSKGLIGKCNVILDAKGASLPPMSITTKILPLCQRFFAGRLGVVVIANMGMPAQIFFKMVLPFIPIDVRKKIHILPNHGKERLEILKSLVEEQFIPVWLGGKDDYIFDANEYYKSGKYKSNFISDQQGVEYAR